MNKAIRIPAEGARALVAELKERTA